MPAIWAVEHPDVSERIAPDFSPADIVLRRMHSRLSNWTKRSATTLSWEIANAPYCGPRLQVSATKLFRPNLYLFCMMSQSGMEYLVGSPALSF
jgi:hypothetical protein